MCCHCQSQKAWDVCSITNGVRGGSGPIAIPPNDVCFSSLLLWLEGFRGPSVQGGRHLPRNIITALMLWKLEWHPGLLGLFMLLNQQAGKESLIVVINPDAREKSSCCSIAWGRRPTFESRNSLRCLLLLPCSVIPGKCGNLIMIVPPTPPILTNEGWSCLSR